MAEYIELPLTADATALSDLGKDYLAEAISGWTARPGNVESVLLEADGQIGAEIVDQVAQVPPVIFAYFGQWLLGIGLREATPATATVTLTFDAGAVVTVPEGTLLAAPNPDGESYVFQTDVEVRSDTAPFTTTVTALEPGEAANGCQGACELIDVVEDVASVSMTVVASGGADEEDADDYLDRLADALTILAPRPILPGDFATMALQVSGVGRAVAIDLYQPGTNDNIAAGQPGGPLAVEGTPVNTGAGLTNVARCVSVAITAEDGHAPTQALMHTTWLTLDAAREVNFLAYVIPPTYTTVEVTATVVPFPGYVYADVQAAAVEMVETWLDPLSWGSQAVGEAQGWTRETTARIYEAVDFISRADGVNYVKTVQLRAVGGVFASNDLVLPGVAPLPLTDATHITITVVAS
jgi:Baseplate J-like protein